MSDMNSRLFEIYLTVGTAFLFLALLNGRVISIGRFDERSAQLERDSIFNS